ncbi:DUF7550 family protein [Halonotius terrestris]|uniref:DUF7550 family protein n=1 Tax=Halonotius terrestris TaxID=2487750 RepID=UPI00163BAD6D|nr:hypothetical protein [Halonotius terrestris]
MTAHDHEGDDGFDRHEESDAGRVTAPMQAFTTQQATTGGLILLAGLAVVFGLPLLVL